MECHNSISNFRDCIQEDTQAVGFFALYKGGTVSTGFSYEDGTALTPLVGAAEALKDRIKESWE